MIRALVLFWCLPMGFFWTWYFLSLNDINFGMLFFSRALHDQVFRIYGDLLGVDPAALPPMVAKAVLTDSLFVLGFVAFKKRREIAAWWAARRNSDALPQGESRPSSLQ